MKNPDTNYHKLVELVAAVREFLASYEQDACMACGPGTYRTVTKLKELVGGRNSD